MTAPRGKRGAEVESALGGNNIRGALLIAVAVVVGVVLLGKGLEGGILPTAADTPSEQAGGDDGATDGTDGATQPTNADGTPAPTTLAPPVTHAPATVKVQVLNGGGPAGSAGASADILNAQNFVASAGDTTDVPATAVFYVVGYDADAALVATALGIPALPQPMPAVLPTGATADSNVVVVLGGDFTAPA